MNGRTCQRCNMDMEHGSLFSAPMFIPTRVRPAGLLERIVDEVTHPVRGPYLHAFRCPACNTVELVASDEPVT